ncbi:hypothetical protein N7510_010031 [Penicillium lagena]|uniref:uncharacterized protein n=1 Tax=Penicillium lagena TaxID=94218 RepID=UPI0025401011|nr:uncharacterized protein N7510_010031 [Penicillium lagena]KAJ5604877.1 hypothetical protein N7510_010031 [Penicillium lagena]
MSDAKKQEQALKQLQAEQSLLLDKIDELRTIGVGTFVQLPQLIVCGNQSSGKSSVLEAISRVSFPIKSTLCTRFATEVSLRRHPTARFKVTIEPGPSRKSDTDCQKLRAFAPAALDNSDRLPSLIEQARKCMGIGTEIEFSDDILKIEICGPDKPDLTLVDLPGLYYAPSSNQGEQGVAIVRNLTERYMKNKRSIILAVVSAKMDYHVQEVLEIAKNFDADRERTMGIITQPDTLEVHSEEEGSWLKMVKNEELQLQLGWHALRNRSFETRDVSDDERDEQEREFFNHGKWASIARDCVGIDSLRRRLSSILLKQIRRNLPGLINDINAMVSGLESKLAKLGGSRSTLQQQKGFLLSLSSSFEHITEQALNGMYTDDFFGSLKYFGQPSTQYDRRLRAVVRQLNEDFAAVMDHYGCQRFIVGLNGAKFPNYSPSSALRGSRKPKWVSRSHVEDEIKEQARQNRGIELPGTANQLLVGNLFRDQSNPWEEIARNHLMKAWDSVSFFVNLVLQYLTDKHTCQSLRALILGPELDKMKDQLLSKLKELTAYNKRGYPLPLGRDFLTRIQKARNDRQVSLLEHELQSRLPRNDRQFTLEMVRQASQKLESSSDQFAAAEIIDQMQAYYDTAILTFVDNVATLGIENCLLEPLKGIFTSQTVNNMDDKQVQDLAAEPSYIMEERIRSTVQLEKLKAGLRVLNQFNVPMTPVRPAHINFTMETNLPERKAETFKPSNLFNVPTQTFGKLPTSNDEDLSLMGAPLGPSISNRKPNLFGSPQQPPLPDSSSRKGLFSSDQ